MLALEVETGDVLAMASYPSFDPNLFATGISYEDWQSLQSKNPRDPLSPLPLFNVAARTAVQPGSTFKMVTATAALDSGLDPNRKLRDGGAVKVGNRTYGCILWNMYRGNHGSLNLHEAIEVSCNYYFFDIAVGRDFYRGGSLGYNEEINIEKITHFAEQYGLGLPLNRNNRDCNTCSKRSTKDVSNENYLRNVLTGRAELYFVNEVINNKELLMEQIDTIRAGRRKIPAEILY